ncbi:MAG: hypothetical protein K8T20_07420 [Planctomycetes bacterium]|nr:hypothetical protein [Planctomycetota bacterium]
MTLKKFGAFVLMLAIVGALAAGDTALAYRTFLNRDYVKTELERIVGRRVNLQEISFGPFQGLVAQNFEIPKRDGSPFLRAESIRIILDRNRLMEGKVSIASIELVRPMVRLEITKDGRGELIELITEVATHAGEAQAKGGGPIPKISVKEGEFVFAYEALMKAGVEIAVKHVDANILPYGPDEFVLQGSADAGVLGKWRIEGRIDTATGRSEVRLGTKGLVLGEHMVAAFGEEVQRVYRMYRLEGPTDANVTGTYDPHEAKPISVVAEVLPRGISVTYENFKYKVLNVQGLIRLKDDGIEFQGMTSKFWPQGADGESAEPVAGAQPIEISMSGSTDGYVGESAYQLHFNIENLPITRKLRGALQKDAGNVYDLFSPAGLLRGKVDVLKPHGAGIPITHNIEMNMVDCSATFKPFPLPIVDVTGLIVLRGEELTIEGARCRNRDSWFSVNGHLTSINADGGIEVTVDAEKVALTEDARLALPEAVRAIWKHFSPEGAIGFHWVTKREPGPDKELTYDVTVRPKGVTASFDGVPYRATDLEGEVWTNAKRVDVKRLTGKHGPANIEIRGKVEALDAEPSYDMTINAEEIPIDGDLRAALPSDFSQMITDMNLKGVLKIDALNFRKGGDDLPAGTSKYGAKSIALFEGSFDAGLGFREVVADLFVDGTIGPDSHTVRGQIKDATLRLEDLKVTKVRANFVLTGGELRIDDIESTCYAGRLSGDVVYDTNSTQWKVGLKAVNVDLLQLTRDTTMAGKNITGRASGDLKMEGKAGNSKGFTGGGALSFKDSELYEVPLLARVFDVLSFGKKDVFEKGSVEFDVGDGRFKLKDLRLVSNSVDLLSDKGYLDFDGKIRLKMSPKFHGLVGTTLLRLVSGLSAIYVEGEFKDPDVSIQPTVDIEKFFK